MDPTELEFEFLRVNLGFMQPDEVVRKYMLHLIDAARLELDAAGIDLIETKEDDRSLVVMYAAWLYRKRDGTGAMPDMLRAAINNHKTRVGAVAT